MKKRLLAGLMAGALMLGGGACAQTEKEITFRGVEWGLSGIEAIAAVKDSLSSSLIPIEDTKERYDGEFVTSDGSSIYQGGYRCYNKVFVPLGLKVADYPVSVVSMYLIPSVEGGTVNDRIDDCVYVKGEYYFSGDGISDYEAAYKDFRLKMVSLYGDPDEERAIGASRGSVGCAWLGANDTELQLLASHGASGKVEMIVISYSVADIGDRVALINDAALQASQSKSSDGEGISGGASAVDVGSTDGL